MRGKQGHTIHFSGGKIFSVDELYDRFYDELVLWADTILNDMGEAEDLVQDFFVRLWEKKLNENLEREQVRSYLYVSVRNMAIRKVKIRVGCGGFRIYRLWKGCGRMRR
ncbi:MAG: sigma factor [Butyricimonas faecihominis]